MDRMEKALSYLYKDKVSYIDMIEPIRRGNADILYADKDGVILLEKMSHTHMIAMNDVIKCRQVIELETCKQVAVHGENIADWIRKNCDFEHAFEAYQAVYMHEEWTQQINAHIKLLKKSDSEVVCKYYDTMDDKSYIEELITKEQLWGIYENNSLAGFIGVHLEGSMGLLEILPEYRRRGYGYQLEGYLIQWFLERGQTPFCQVVNGNEMSLALQKKLGMTLSEEKVIWFF